MKILLAGDTVGNPGRRACAHFIPRLRKEENLDFVVVNGENIAGGSSITLETVQEMFDAGVDVLTTGDHIFKKKEAFSLVEIHKRILRPLNYPPQTPGRGYVTIKAPNGVPVAVVNLLGRVFLKTVDCPFRAIDQVLPQIHKEAKVILVDMHAEATSEKVAMGWFLDGKVSAVVGSHTHVQTADEMILPNGTAYLTELGMCGPYASVIGRKVDQVLTQFITQIPTRLEVAEDDARLCGAIIDVDPETGRATAIKRVQKRLDGKD